MSKCLHSDHYHQEASEPGLTGLENLYIPTSSLVICFSVLEDGGPSAKTCLETERRACPQPAAFFSQRTRITSSTYVYTSFVSDLVLAKSVAVGKLPRQTLLFDCLLYWPHIAWARCHHYEIESTLRKNRVHHFWSVTYIDTRPSPDFSPRLRDKIWEWPGNEASGSILSAGCLSHLRGWYKTQDELSIH